LDEILDISINFVLAWRTKAEAMNNFGIGPHSFLLPATKMDQLYSTSFEACFKCELQLNQFQQWPSTMVSSHLLKLSIVKLIVVLSVCVVVAGKLQVIEGAFVQ
jgi:hypothetical protein